MIEDSTKFGDSIWVIERDSFDGKFTPQRYRFLAFTGKNTVCCCPAYGFEKFDSKPAKFEDSLVQKTANRESFLQLVPVWECFPSCNAARLGKSDYDFQVCKDKGDADEIISTRIPLGKFLFKEAADVYVGIDNSTGDAWTEEFPTLLECMRWLADADKEGKDK